tara:strand:+ start:2471 stop:2731 length:261 start_codon:yes stop_codon:yes gene_type:complete
MKHTPTLYIDGKETPFEYGAAGTTDSAMNDYANNVQRVFIMGHDVKGRYCRVGSVSLPAGMFTNGGTCRMNGKEYKIRKYRAPREW